MERKDINIVWLKRDLRLNDHQPLYIAEQHNLDYLIIYIFDNNLISYPDTSLRHLQFQYHSILEMNDYLDNYNRKIHLFKGDSLDIFKHLNQKYKINSVFSYQESGIELSYVRDLNLKKLFNNERIKWIEFQNNGVIRGNKIPSDWNKKWFDFMNQPQIHNTFSFSKIELVAFKFKLTKEFTEKLTKYNNLIQPAGERNAWRYLKSFIKDRGINYSKHISKPALSRTSCSRLSPYLSWGNLSIRQVYQFIKISKPSMSYKSPYSNMMSRLIWHCHFIQKFEIYTPYETEHLNRAFDNFAYSNDLVLLQKWKDGDTGVPIIDANMRCLKATGWINFRMRAMLVSFLSHYLLIDWRKGVYHLAQLFIDYEPGIHFPQFQMQAGTTSVHTLRIYNPVKQSQDHDSDTLFIQKWIPELSLIPNKYIHTPWLMPEMEQMMSNFKLGVDYPFPIIDLDNKIKNNRKKIWDFKNDEYFISEKQRVIDFFSLIRNT